MESKTNEVNQYDELIQLIEDQKQDYLSTEFDDIDDPVRSFRFEYAMESVTETNSRFKRRNSF